MTLPLVLALAAALAPQAPGADIDLGGKLYRAVFTSGAGVLAAADVEKVPEPARTRLTAYLSRRAAFKSLYRNDADSLEKVRADAKKRLIERALVALIDAPGVEKMALEFVERAPIAYEWEGAPAAPLAEASYAEDALKKNPSSALAPYLYVFVAQRQRAAFEAADAKKDVEAMKAAAKKYRAFMQRARAVADPIFPLLADDLDRQPHVYMKTDKHPRDFNPDA